MAEVVQAGQQPNKVTLAAASWDRLQIDEAPAFTVLLFAHNARVFRTANLHLDFVIEPGVREGVHLPGSISALRDNLATLQIATPQVLPEVEVLD
eukprot:1569851-Rhodomonas_salina.4